MAQGYRNRPDLEARVFQEGWYRSGDLARLDIDGTLQIFGRAVDIAFVDGRMVGPTSTEDALCQLPDVRYACVVREVRVSRWIALVLPHHGVPLDLPRCRRAMAPRHGPAVADRMVWHTPDHVPLTPQGKPDRETIRALAAEGTVPAVQGR